MAKVTPAMPVIVFPWASAAFPEKFTNRGTADDEASCWAFMKDTLNSAQKRETLRKSDRKHLANFMAVLLLDLVALDLSRERPSGRERILVRLRVFSNGAHLKLP